MNKKVTLIILFSLILVFGCAQKTDPVPASTPESTGTVLQYQAEEQKINQSEHPSTIRQVEENPVVKTVSSAPGLGDLCSGQEACTSFCNTNRGRCETYCDKNPQNELCSLILFKPRPSSELSALCNDTTTPFLYAPVNLEKTVLLLPLGLMSGGHVTPIDHHYFQNFGNTGFDIEVYSPGEGVITEIQHMPGAKEGEDYRLVIQHTCTVSSIYIHIGVLSEKLQADAPTNHGYKGVKIPVTAGEIIGYYSTNVDYNLVDLESTLDFIMPDHYKPESWKIHVPRNTYDYFTDDVKNKLIAKSVRTIEPITGKIDYDVDGKLIGNWFVENTNGYEGIRKEGTEYWNTHLAFAYEFTDPSLVIVSMGDFDGNANQFAVKGNSPDPKSIGVESGLVKYELVSWGHITQDGSEWDKTSFAKVKKAVGGTSVEGTVLVEMLADRKIKFESFPGKEANEVDGFTANAKIYER